MNLPTLEECFSIKHSSGLLICVFKSKNRWLALIPGTHLWSAGPSVQYAVGDVVIKFGNRYGVIVDDVKPEVKVLREDGTQYKAKGLFGPIFPR